MLERFTLANRRHLIYFVGLLICDGSLCPKCGKGARHTSKNWARCKNEKCGHRFRRQLDLSAEQRAQARARESESNGRPLGVPNA